jgi:hypothetical protein
VISVKIAGSSMVAGILYSSLSAIFLIVPLNTLPDLVLGSLLITIAVLNAATGPIALGHPIGASGARVLVSLIHEMTKRKAKKGLATLCVGGGMGIAMCIERNFLNHK